MNISKWLATTALASVLGVSDVSAQEVQYKTMEIHSIAGQQEPVFVDVARRHRRRRARPRYVVKRRSRRRSAEIVGGTAAGGAALGALAGGGKGAAIGAVAGGGAGYVYDRNTHKKRVRVE